MQRVGTDDSDGGEHACPGGRGDISLRAGPTRQLSGGQLNIAFRRVFRDEFQILQAPLKGSAQIQGQAKSRDPLTYRCDKGRQIRLSSQLNLSSTVRTITVNGRAKAVQSVGHSLLPAVAFPDRDIASAPR